LWKQETIGPPKHAGGHLPKHGHASPCTNHAGLEAHADCTVGLHLVVLCIVENVGDAETSSTVSVIPCDIAENANLAPGWNSGDATCRHRQGDAVAQTGIDAADQLLISCRSISALQIKGVVCDAAGS
jgi:hypothetical protein